MKWQEIKKYHIRNLKNYEEIGVEKFQISTCKDERVCATCAAREGKLFDVAQAAKDVDSLNVCTNAEGCRCCLVAEITF